MDKDSIKEFLEKRYDELSREEILPKLEKKKESPPPTKEKTKKPLFKLILIWVFGLVLSGASLYFGIKVYERWKIDQASHVDILLEKIGNLTEIPESEAPTVATVTNANLIKNQLFFKEAKTGDKLIIFKRSKKAILYRPSTDKIVSISALN